MDARGGAPIDRHRADPGLVAGGRAEPGLNLVAHVVRQARVLAFEPAITELLLEFFGEFRLLASPEPEPRRSARLRILDRQGKARLRSDAKGALDVGWTVRPLQHVGKMHLAVEQGD